MQKASISDAIATALARHPAKVPSSPSVGCPPNRFIDPIRYRDDLGGLLKELQLTGVGVEVGTQSGEYTRRLLEGWETAGLFVQVDLWQHQKHYKDVANLDNATQLRFMELSCLVGQEMVRQGHAKSVAQCRDYSTECVKLFPDGSLDFVYIDARHDRKGVLQDLSVFWPKLREGGVMAGHDYTLQNEPHRMVPGENDPTIMSQDWTMNFDGTRDTTGRVVRGAVNDFFSGVAPDAPQELKRCPRQPVIAYREPAWNTWVVRK